MLAYFFYHWKFPNVLETEYEQRLAAFHGALNAAPPDGFAHSASFALTGPAWANAGGPSYEDWYILNSSADLDPLNDAAVSASRKIPHDRVASGTEGGSGGLYRIRLGELTRAPRFTAWFAKPDGWSYAELSERLSPTLARGGTLWQRQMALGPGEFCLHSSEPAEFPTGIDASSVALRSVFPQSV
jgi:hypothetical protein